MMYTDMADVFRVAAKELGIPRDESFAGKPQTNALIERMNGDLAKGVRVLLVQAGLPPPFWHLALEHYCVAKNVKIVEGTSAWFRKFKKHFEGQSIPFGAMVDFIPTATSSVGKAATKYSPSTVKGIMVGYATGVGETWNRGYRVIPLESLRGMDFSVKVRPENCRRHIQVVSEVSPVIAEGLKSVVFGKWFSLVGKPMTELMGQSSTMSGQTYQSSAMPGRQTLRANLRQSMLRSRLAKVTRQTCLAVVDPDWVMRVLSLTVRPRLITLVVREQLLLAAVLRRSKVQIVMMSQWSQKVPSMVVHRAVV